ncbi:hypothetical protein ACP4OV_001576 [Aristida adscensionis]
MSRQINEEHDDRRRDVQVVDADPAAAVPMRTASGRRGYPVLIAPAGAGGASAPAMSTQLQGFVLLPEDGKPDDDPATQRKKWFKEMRGWLMVLATVAASVTYQAGLNPPGGFWQDEPDAGGKVSLVVRSRAGDPVLRDEHWSRYMMFFYFNSTAFVTSLVIMVLLMSERFYHTEAKVVALMLTTFVDLASLVGAYIAGSTRFFSSCIYVIVITCVAFVGVILIGEVMADVCSFIMRTFPCMAQLAKNRWCPVPQELVENAIKAREERTAGNTNSNRAACSACCAPRGRSPERAGAAV